MKKVYLLFAFISFIGFSQEKYLTKTGLLNFEASVPSFEEIKATNTNVTAIFNAANGQFATLALVKGFRFKNALMEEHFNESYAESDSYPKPFGPIDTELSFRMFAAIPQTVTDLPWDEYCDEVRIQ